MSLTRQELAIARVKCDKDLLFFVRFFYKAIHNQKLIVNWHHKELCGHFQDLLDYKLDLLNINIPPRCSKTLIMLMTICRGIGENHGANWLYITASDNLRKKTTTDIRRVLQHPFFKVMYGLEISKDQNSKDTIGFVGGGSLTTASIMGQIVGFGAGQMIDNDERIKEEHEFSHLKNRVFEGGIFCDDLNKPNDSANDNANNQTVTDVVFNTVFSRKNSGDTPIVNIQQRVGMTDVTNALMEHYGREDARARFVIMPIVYPNGKLLWEWRYSREEANRLKTSHKTAHVYETQYMQDPTVLEGAMLERRECSFFTGELDKDLISSKAGAIDVADVGGDFFSYPIGSIIGERIYITDWVYTQSSMEYTRPACASLIASLKINHTAVETNTFGIGFYRQLKKEIPSTATLYGVIAKDKKYSRILNKAEFIKKHFVFRSDAKEGSDYDKALKHLFRYMLDGSFKIDDAIDSLASLATLVQELHLIK